MCRYHHRQNARLFIYAPALFEICDSPIAIIIACTCFSHQASRRCLCFVSQLRLHACCTPVLLAFSLVFVRSRWAPEAAQKEHGDREECDAGNLWDGRRKILVHASLTFKHYAQCDQCYDEVCMSAELTINKVNTICRDQGNGDEDDESKDDAETACTNQRKESVSDSNVSKRIRRMRTLKSSSCSSWVHDHDLHQTHVYSFRNTSC